MVVIGTSGGDIHLLEVSENLAQSTPNDRPAMAVVLDRETRREKLLENKGREIKLKGDKELKYFGLIDDNILIHLYT